MHYTILLDTVNSTPSTRFMTNSTDVLIQSTYSSELIANSPTYTRYDVGIGTTFYYESIQIQTFFDGVYSFSINSDVEISGYLYERAFNPIDPSENLIFKHYGYCDASLFKVDSHLRSKTTYILVVTPYKPRTVGTFSVAVTGLNQVFFTSSKQQTD